MANTDAAFGFRPIEGIGGSKAARTHEYVVTTSTAIGDGDLVTRSAGVVQRYAAADVAVIGVAAHWVSSSGAGRTLHVYDDPGQFFVAQTDDNTHSLVVDHEGQNFSVIVAAANTTTGRSKMELDGSSDGAGNTTRILHCVQVFAGRDPSGTVNDATASWTRCVVKINDNVHQLANTPADGAA